MSKKVLEQIRAELKKEKSKKKPSQKRLDELERWKAELSRDYGYGKSKPSVPLPNWLSEKKMAELRRKER